MASRAGGAFEFEINPFNAIDEAASSDSNSPANKKKGCRCEARLGFGERARARV